MKTGTQVVGQTEIKATEWKKDGKHRIYFRENRDHSFGNACWDVVAGEWKNAKCEFGPRFKARIRKVFEF